MGQKVLVKQHSLYNSLSIIIRFGFKNTPDPTLQKVWNQERRTCEAKDILPIAFGQMALENRLAKRADKVLICDTDLLETKVYSEEYYGGYVDPLLEKGAQRK